MMADTDPLQPSPSTPPGTSTKTSATTITDLNLDSLVNCTSYLNIQDLSNMAVSCKYLQRAAYSDSIWQSLFRQRWPQPIPLSFSQMSSVREEFLARHTALQKFKYVDPLVADFYTDAKSHDHMLLEKNDIIFSQGSLVRILNVDNFLNGRDSLVTLSDHHSRITSMRLFSLGETFLYRNENQRSDNVLVTSSCDHTIRLWWKGSCHRCLKGHSGPVSVLSDKLLGDDTGKILASGGVDGTVRLWSINSSGKRGQQALKATLFGHEKPVVLMSVAGHRTSLLVSASKNSKVRVWDTTTSSAVRSSCCVGMTSVPGAPIGMKCHESLLYVAAGSSVIAIDLRTMHRVFTVMHGIELYSFAALPSNSLICTGGAAGAMLWDVRRSCNSLKTEPVSELDGHKGPVKLLHMDKYKIVTGGPEDAFVNVWETDTGSQTNSLLCSSPEGLHSGSGCSAMAVSGCRIVTASGDDEQGVVRFRDFNHAICNVSSDDRTPVSKFWDPESQSDSEESEPDLG